MNRTRMLVLALFSLALSAVIALFAYRFLQARLSSEMTTIVVATQRLPLGTRLAPGHLRVVSWPKSSLMAGSFSDSKELVGRGVVVPLSPGELLLEGKLAPKEAGAGLSSAIPEGMRAVAVKVDPVTAVGGFVLPGLSQKGAQAGNASYYYSYTRLKTEGTINLEGKNLLVSGFSWMDREWSTSALSEDQIGWDWFALHLEADTELMYYQLRKNDGTPDVYSKGTLVQRDGSRISLAKEDVTCSVTDSWESPSGVLYPSGWRLVVPRKNIDLVITPAVKNQLLDVSIDYWEGSVTVEGTRNGATLAGRGYVELTGY